MLIILFGLEIISISLSYGMVEHHPGMCYLYMDDYNWSEFDIISNFCENMGYF